MRRDVGGGRPGQILGALGQRRLYHVKWYRRFRRSDRVSAGLLPGLYHFPNLKWYRQNARSGGVLVPLYQRYQRFQT
ncbi:hypothetical protein GCM10029976_067300 [Kribbella albertanoniae]